MSQPETGSLSRPFDVIPGDQAVAEFPCLTLRLLKSLRSSGRINYHFVGGRACYRRIDLYNYVESCKVGAR